MALAATSMPYNMALLEDKMAPGGGDALPSLFFGAFVLLNNCMLLKLIIAISLGRLKALTEAEFRERRGIRRAALDTAFGLVRAARCVGARAARSDDAMLRLRCA
jgi:hypothetical protein